jgi:hypothetical protein
MIPRNGNGAHEASANGDATAVADPTNGTGAAKPGITAPTMLDSATNPSNLGFLIAFTPPANGP